MPTPKAKVKRFVTANGRVIGAIMVTHDKRTFYVMRRNIPRGACFNIGVNAKYL